MTASVAVVPMRAYAGSSRAARWIRADAASRLAISDSATRDSSSGQRGGGLDAALHPSRAHRADDRLHRERARDCAAGLAPHSVADERVEAARGVDRGSEGGGGLPGESGGRVGQHGAVLVVGALLAAIGPRGGGNNHFSRRRRVGRGREGVGFGSVTHDNSLKQKL